MPSRISRAGAIELAVVATLLGASCGSSGAEIRSPSADDAVAAFFSLRRAMDAAKTNLLAQTTGTAPRVEVAGLLLPCPSGSFTVTGTLSAPHQYPVLDDNLYFDITAELAECDHGMSLTGTVTYSDHELHEVGAYELRTVADLHLGAGPDRRPCVMASIVLKIPSPQIPSEPEADSGTVCTHTVHALGLTYWSGTPDG